MNPPPEEKKQPEPKLPEPKKEPEPKEEPESKEPEPKEPSPKEPEQKEPSGEKTQQEQKQSWRNEDKIDKSQFQQGNDNKMFNYIHNDSRGDARSFSINNDSYSLSKQDINLVKDHFVYPPDRLDELIGFLKEQHVLLLTGEAGSGKYFTAQYLCSHLMSESKTGYDVRLVEPLRSRISLELSKLINNKEQIDGKILIFKDVFKEKNQDIMRFLESCSREPVFKKSDVFIIITADNDTFDNYHLGDLKIKKEIAQIDNNLLLEGLTSTLKHFCSLPPKKDFAKISQQFENQKEEIIAKLKNMSNISGFFEKFLDGIVSKEITVGEAIDKVLDIRKYLEHWFLTELGMRENEFEAWTFSLCLTIFKEIPYTIFNDIHREITLLLLEKMDPFKTLKGFTFTLSESELLKKCKAQITRDPDTLADKITFEDQNYHTELLKILLENNRRVLLSILPVLENYIKSHNLGSHRRLVAISIARIGALAPQTIILPIVEKWLIEVDSLWQNVGYLYEGIFNSDDDKYKGYCLSILKLMAFSENVLVKKTAIVAYKQIGLLNLEFAVDAFLEIQEDTLNRESEKEEIIRRFIYAAVPKEKEKDVLKILDNIYEESDVILNYIRLSIAAWSVSWFSEPIWLYPIDVLDRLKKWIHKGNRNSRANVVLIFMGEDGILKELAERDVIFSDEDQDGKKEEIRTNLLLYDLFTGEEQVEKMSAFLIDLYNKCFPEFGVEVKKALKKKLFHYLERWIIENLSYSIVINAIEKLIVQLYHAGNDELKDTLWDNINRWKAPGKEEEKLNTFVDNVSKKIFNM